MLDEFIRRIELGLDWATLAELLILFRNKSVKRMFEKALSRSRGPSGKYFEAYLIRRTVGKVIGAMDNENLVNILEVPLGHSDFMVREKVIFNLGRMKDQNSAQLLKIALQDPDEKLHNAALDTLKNRKDEFAKQILTRRTP